MEVIFLEILGGVKVWKQIVDAKYYKGLINIYGKGPKCPEKKR